MRNQSAVTKRQKSDASMMRSTVKVELQSSIKLLKTNILHYMSVCVRLTSIAPPDCRTSDSDVFGDVALKV